MPILDEITYKAAKLTEKTLDNSQELAHKVAKLKLVLQVNKVILMSY